MQTLRQADTQTSEHRHTYDINNFTISYPVYFTFPLPPPHDMPQLTCSHDAMLNPVYIPLDALEEVDVGKTIEDDDEITVNKGALDADPDDAS